MKFIVSSTYLLKQLQVLGGVISNSNTLPILDNFLFDLDGTKLTVSASDLETTMSSVLEVDSQGNILWEWHASDHLEEFGFDDGFPLDFQLAVEGNSVARQADDSFDVDRLFFFPVRFGHLEHHHVPPFDPLHPVTELIDQNAVIPWLQDSVVAPRP